MRLSFSDRALRLLVIGCVAGLLAPAAYGQVLPRNRAPGAAPGPVPAQPAARAPGEGPGQTRVQGRQQARDARAEARQAGETGPQARATARETRQETRQNVQATRAADMGVWLNNTNNGLVVSNLANNGAFATAGFRPGDQLLSINGQPIRTEEQFVQTLTGPNLGTQPVNVAVLRNGAQQTLSLQPSAITQGIVAADPFYPYGMIINSQNPNQLVVDRVFPRTAAYYAGLQQGDIITGLGGQPVTNLNGFTQGLANANAAVPLQVSRAGQTQAIQLDPSLAHFGNNSSVRTAMRPNLDAGTGANANLNGTTPAIGAGAAPGAAVGTGASGAATGSAGANPGAAAARPNPRSGTTPATPATPATPGVSPATPATPATPGAGASASGGASTSGSAGAGTTGSGSAKTGGTGASGASGSSAPR